MIYRTLGWTGIQISALSLGTMTFGEQNNEAEAHAQLDMALAHGVNLIDVAEMYPVPPRAETQGLTEIYVGNWLAQQARDKIVLATKVTGPSRGFDWIRGGPRINPEHMRAALEGSLRRLRTDYIDLYQIHWPDRYVPMFGETAFDARRIHECTPILQQLEVLDEFVQAGKVRYIGLSNETPYGVSEFVRMAEKHGLPRIASIQNAYNLLNRTFENGLAEICHYSNVPLLAYSPLAFSWLTGKLLHNPQAEGRIHQFPNFGRRYAKAHVPEASAEYVRIAQEAGLDPAQMAIAFALEQIFVGSVILGATSLAQLQTNLGALDIQLTSSVRGKLDLIHRRYPNPAP
ncbi:MAG TPA: NADP(H)-dependent aldo-keto reductase [bacterium]|nr:NADP(H)-dependent aldo-keto reductase [bacterium]